MNYNLLIIGAGPGGYRAAEYAAKNGLQVLIVEKGEAGGTCLNCGCIPTKAWCYESQLENRDFSRAVQHKNEVVEQLRSGVEQLMQSPGITFVRGEAQFVDDHTVAVNGEHFYAQNIIIATGSRAKMPPIEGINNSKVVTSTELLNITEVPRKLAIIGAGVIGMEFAAVFNRFGSEVTVVEFLKECLPAMDRDLAKRLRKSMEKQGITFRMSTAVQNINELDADLILVATGRTANTDGLMLQHAGIACEGKGISVNPETYQVGGKKHLYAIGDVNGLSLLAHAATMQGIRAVNHILGRADHIRFDIMPAAVFTNPEAASVGLIEEQAKAQGIAFDCKKGFYRANGKALATDASEGIVKLMADSQGTIIGCHILGAHAADMVQEIAALMNMGATVSQLRDIVHIHPTLSEILQSAAEAF